MRTAKEILRTVAGIAIGVISGIFSAPGKGSKTHQQMKDKGDDNVERQNSKVDGLVNQGKDKFYDIKKDVKNTTANFKHNVATDSNGATL